MTAILERPTTDVPDAGQRLKVGVAIPSIPTRPDLLARAMESVAAQTHPAAQVTVAVDLARQGAAATRNAAWRRLEPDVEWVAFLDDDDEMLPHHIGVCAGIAALTGADMVHPWFEVVGGTDPFPENRGRPFDLAHPHQTTITCLWRRSVLETLGGFREPPGGQDEQGHAAGEDFDLVIRAARAGALMVASPIVTWRWHHHSRNTMGLPSRW